MFTHLTVPCKALAACHQMQACHRLLLSNSGSDRCAVVSRAPSGLSWSVAKASRLKLKQNPDSLGKFLANWLNARVCSTLPIHQDVQLWLLTQLVELSRHVSQADFHRQTCISFVYSFRKGVLCVCESMPTNMQSVENVAWDLGSTCITAIRRPTRNFGFLKLP